MKEYSAVYLRYLDHASNNAAEVTPVVCEVFGILREETDVAYIVISWVSDYDLYDHNSDGYCILKSTVVECKKLIPEER